MITYYQRTRHLFGPLKLEVLDAKGKRDRHDPADQAPRASTASSGSMRVKPPRVPRGGAGRVQLVAGPARACRARTRVRLTRGNDVIETKLAIGLDRRAPYDARRSQGAVRRRR